MNFDQARFAMIEQQVGPWDVLDPGVLEARTSVRREDFVVDAHRNLAFADLPLPLAHGESMLKPVVEGRLLQALALEPGEEVLEIGTGSGFTTACLAQLARAVTSIDIHADFIAGARERLEAAGFGNVRLECDDALAWQPRRPFDAIAVTGPVTEIPPAFDEWRDNFHHAHADCPAFHGPLETWGFGFPILAIDHLWLSPDLVPLRADKGSHFRQDHSWILVETGITPENRETISSGGAAN